MADQITLHESTETQDHHIAQFLARPPRGAAELVLRTDDEEPIRLCLWEDRAQMVPALRGEIAIMAQSHADETGGLARLVLEYLAKAEEGAPAKQLRAMRIVRTPKRGAASSVYQPAPGELDGSSKSMLIQAQRQAETYARMMVEMSHRSQEQTAKLVEHAISVTNMLARQLTESDQRITRAEERALVLQEHLDAAQSTDPEVREGGVDKLVQMLQPLAPVLLQRLIPPQG